MPVHQEAKDHLDPLVQPDLQVMLVRKVHKVLQVYPVRQVIQELPEILAHLVP